MARMFLIFALFTLMLKAALAQTAFANEKKAGHWTSGVLMETATSQPMKYRSIVHMSGADVAFVVDLAPDCEHSEISLILFVEEGSDIEGVLNLGGFQARVDDKGIYDGAWISSSNEMGDEFVFAALYTEHQAQLLRDVRIGNTLRLKFSFVDDEDNDDVYFKFPLIGSTASLARAALLCKQFEAYRSQPSQRSGSRRLNRDSDYF